MSKLASRASSHGVVGHELEDGIDIAGLGRHHPPGDQLSDPIFIAPHV
jgi:hypothetical protein